MELRAKYTLFAEGARGSLSKQIISSVRSGEGSRPAEVRDRAERALEIAPEKTQARTGAHTFGWPLNDSTGGGSFLYHLEDEQVVVGFVVHLNYRNPYNRAIRGVQRFSSIR